MSRIVIGDRKVGEDYPTYIIAEAGLNHDGKAEQAKDLVSEAKKAGADMIKFQIFLPEELCSRSSKSFELFSSLELREDEWRDVAEHAARESIHFSASVFGIRSADLLESIGGVCFKVSSGDLTYEQLIEYVAGKGRPLVISTGMSYLGEVDRAVEISKMAGNEQIALLHCVSSYPSAPEQANLRSICTMKESFHLPIGFSDHTIGHVVPLAAVAMGACIIEKHFTLSRGLPGPDHKLSMIPEEFREMISMIRTVERAKGDGIKRPVEEEMSIRLSARRSIVAKRDIEEGEIIRPDALKIARPGSGIPPNMFNRITARKARHRIAAETPLTWDDI